MDRGMPDFTGKLKEDDVAKIQAFILTCSFPASLQSRLQSDSRDAEACWRKVGDFINLFARDECANYHPAFAGVD